MRYLVEFTLPGDEIKDIVSQSDEQTSESQDLPADVADIGKWKTCYTAILIPTCRHVVTLTEVTVLVNVMISQRLISRVKFKCDHSSCVTSSKWVFNLFPLTL